MTPNPQAPPAPPAGTDGPPSPDDRNMAMLCHLLGIVTTYTIGLGFVGPLIIWLLKKDQSPFVDAHGKEALNFQLTLLLELVCGGVAAFMLTFVLVGLLLFPLLALVPLLALIPEILACLAASRGEPFRYPLSIRFIR